MMKAPVSRLSSMRATTSPAAFSWYHDALSAPSSIKEACVEIDALVVAVDSSTYGALATLVD